MKKIGTLTLYTLYELAKKLDLNYMTLWKWRKDGRFPTVKVVGKVYIEEDVFNNIQNYIVK